MYVVAIFLCLVISLSPIRGQSEVDLKDKVTIVTGAARGIGRAIADNLLKEDVKVVIIVDKNLTQGLVTESEFKSQYGEDKVWFIHGDVTTDLERVCDEIFERYEYVDVLVNNAGIVDENDPELTIKTNLLAPVLWSRRFYNLTRIDQGGKGGIILNIASIEGYIKDPFVKFYRTAKYGIIGLSTGLGHEWNYMHSGVKVIPLCPGLTNTDLAEDIPAMGEESEIPMLLKYMYNLPLQEPDAVGQAAITVCKNGTTGTTYTIEGGVLSVSPYGKDVTVEYLLSLP